MNSVQLSQIAKAAPKGAVDTFEKVLLTFEDILTK